MTLAVVYTTSFVSALVEQSDPAGYISMPGGWLIHSTCIHHLSAESFLVHRADNETEIRTADTIEKYTACPFPPIRTAVINTTIQNVGYYSDWAVYAKEASSKGSSLMFPLTRQRPTITKTHIR